MLGALKAFIKILSVPVLFISGFGVMLASMFKEARWGFILLVLMIPQPNIWYKFHEYPMGKDVLDFLFLSILFGIFIQKKKPLITSNLLLTIILIFTSYFALWNSSLNFSLPLPVTGSNPLFADWKNFAQMIMLYFLAVSVTEDEDQVKIIVICIAIVILFISVRNFRNFSAPSAYNDLKRVSGPFETVGLGPNHFGAFIAMFGAMMFGLFLFDDHKKRKILFLVTYLFSLHPLFFSYSRGAYMASLASVTILAFLKKKSILILVVLLLIAWKTILPPTVVERISMTENESGELDSSSAHRMVLWEYALDAFENNPVFGVGFNSFVYVRPDTERLTDTHNYFVKILCEQGMIGFMLLLILFLKAFRSGWQLYRRGSDNFLRGLGLGFMGCVIACIISNFFGDRFSYYVLGGYFWILWGLVDKGILITNHGQDSNVLT